MVNGYIPSRSYMPVGYGQLGCSGFIISDDKGNFVSRKTAAYLQFGEAAFRKVESLLSELVPIHSKKDDAPPSSMVMKRSSLPEPREKRETSVMQAPKSVGVDVMDDEHQICADSFNRAIKDPTTEHLQQLHDILKAHFDHEEELIAKYSSTKGSFSSLNSHRMDHQRILEIATAELQRVNTSTCSLQQGGRE